jgi:DnaJ like chaperone protein
MSTEEIMVVVVGLLVGYWVISAFIGNTTRPPVDADDKPEAPGGSAAYAQQAWYEVLGISANASLEEIQAAYRSLMSQYHPDKVASLGVELQELAEVKSRAINKAYADALAAFGSRP